MDFDRFFWKGLNNGKNAWDLELWNMSTTWKTSCGWVDNIKMTTQEIIWDGVDCAWDRVK